MSVLVKDMNLPENCFDCDFSNRGRSACCIRTRNPIGIFNGLVRPRDCPLVPLPEKHGRLIDADALFKHLFLTDGGYIANDRDSDGWPHVCTYESIKKAIHEALTIIEVEGGGTATLDELCDAIRLIRDTCAKTYQDMQKGCSDCVLDSYCRRNHDFGVPCEDWGDPDEGGDEDGI